MYALHAQQNTPSHWNETWSDWKGCKVRRRCQGMSHKSENHTKTDSFLSGGWSDEGLVLKHLVVLAREVHHLRDPFAFWMNLG